MPTKFSSSLYKLSSNAITFLALLVFLIFSALFLPSQTALADRYSQGSGSPDTSLFYTPADLINMAANYGSEGRAAYVKARLTFDLAFPIIYTFFLVTCISWTSRRVLGPAHFLRAGNILPFYALLFDVLENTCAALVFSRFPTQLPFIAAVAPFFTLMKWICVGSSFTLLTGLCIGYLIKTINKKSRSS